MGQAVIASWNLSDELKIKDVLHTAKRGTVPVLYVAVVEGVRSEVSGKRSPIVQMFRR